MVIRCNRNLLVDLQVRDLLLSAPAVTEQDSCVLGTENAVRRTIHVYIRVKPKHRTVDKYPVGILIQNCKYNLSTNYHGFY